MDAERNAIVPPPSTPRLLSKRSERNWSAERDRLNDESLWSLSTAERFVLDAVIVHIAAHDEGWPTQGRLALQTGLSERQVRRIIEALVSAGFLTARVVPSGGLLPNGHRVNGARLVYARGKPRTPPLRSIAPERREIPPGHGVRSSGPGGGHGVRGVPDMVSGEWKEKTKEQNTHSDSEDLDRERGAAGESASSLRDAAKDGGAVLRVLTYWREKLCPDLRGQLDSDERTRVLRTRLAEGFTEEDLQRAVDAASSSSWHRANDQTHRLRISVLFGKAEMVADLAARGRRARQPSLARAAPRPPDAPVCTPAENVASAQGLLAVLSRQATPPRQLAEASA